MQALSWQGQLEIHFWQRLHAVEADVSEQSYGHSCILAVSIGDVNGTAMNRHNFTVVKKCAINLGQWLPSPVSIKNFH